MLYNAFSRLMPDASFGGVILVSLSDSVQPQQPPGPASRPLAHVVDLAPHPILGDTLALISALFYAFYVILLKVRIRSESRVDMQLFFGFVGLFNILLCWPMGIFLHLIGVETLELPKGDAVAALAINVHPPFVGVRLLIKVRDRWP